MKLLELEVRNLGLYRDAHRFDFSTGTPPRNLVLVTGHNGAGKTTLFNALSLALHGALSLGDRVSRNAYHAHLLTRFHRYSGTQGLFDGVRERAQAAAAGVRLDFEFVRSGRSARVEVDRRWHRQGTEVEETLGVSVDGKEPDAHPEDYQAFLNDLVPPGLGFLCFFDAERLDALSHPDNATLLAEAIRRLLGLDVVRRLRTDLERYSAAQKAEGTHSRPLFDALFEADAGAERDRMNLADLRTQLESLEERHSALRAQMAEVERHLDAEGSGYAKRRGRLQKRLEKLGAEVRDGEARLAVLATGLLPFTLTPELSLALDERLVREGQAAADQAARAAWHARVQHVAGVLEATDFWQGLTLPDPTRQQLRGRFLKTLALPLDEAGQRVVHHLAEPERARLRGWLHDITKNVPAEVEGISAALMEKIAERTRLQADLDRVPDNEVLRPLHEALSRLADQALKLDAQRADLLARQAAVEAKLADSEKRREKTLAELELSRAAERRLELAGKGQLVLRTFEDALTRQRLDALEGTLVTRFNALCRKDQLLDRARIDPRTFEVQLYAADGFPLPVEGFSAGERQLFGLSLLWALRDVTNHNLPLVIDTPLGRLDQLHRERMMRDFVPAVSDQVVLLTTDAELDETLLDAVRPRLARTYRLTFDTQRGETFPSVSPPHEVVPAAVPMSR